MKLMDDYEHISFLVNTYMVHSLKKPDKSVNLKKFIEEVYIKFKNKGLSYSETEILLTWKELVEEYYYYKKNFGTDYATSAWHLFSLMDNCFDRKDVAEKFTSKHTFSLIDCMSIHRETLATQGLTQSVLDSVENHFREMGDNDINQSDIFAQWEILKQSYRETRLLMKQRCRNIKLNEFYDAMRVFYQSPEFQGHRVYNIPAKKRTAVSDVSEISNKRTNEEIKTFNSELRYQLLACIKNKKSELGYNKELSPSLLSFIIETFKRLGYNFSTETICNEWNDLYYRYELLKSNDNPYHWKYFNEVNDICNSVEPVVVENVENNTDSEGAAVLKEKYSKNYSEIPALRELMLENNLSGEEVTYLLDTFDS